MCTCRHQVAGRSVPYRDRHMPTNALPALALCILYLTGRRPRSGGPDKTEGAPVVAVCCALMCAGHCYAPATLSLSSAGAAAPAAPSLLLTRVPLTARCPHSPTTVAGVAARTKQYRTVPRTAGWAGLSAGRLAWRTHNTLDVTGMTQEAVRWGQQTGNDGLACCYACERRRGLGTGATGARAWEVKGPCRKEAVAA